MIPRLKPTVGKEEFLALCTPSMGRYEIECFEKAFATLMGQEYAIAFPYGRTAITILLEAMGIKNKEVICPAYTCIVVPHAVVTSGNEPVFIDSQEKDFNMDLELAEQAINENTAAIIATSIFGYPVDIIKLRQIRDKYPHVKIIQDCAHSFAANHKGYEVQQQGDAAIFGLGISKLITSIQGGMVTTDDKKLNLSLRAIGSKKVLAPSWQKIWRRRIFLAISFLAFSRLGYSFTNLLERGGFLNKLVKYYDEYIIDMPSDYLIGMCPLEAKIGQIQINRYQQIVENRRSCAHFYNKQLQNLKKHIKLPPLIDGATYSHYVLRTEKREEILAFGIKNGVQFGQLIEYNIPEIKSYAKRSGSKLPCPVSSQMAKTAINLPLWIKDQKVRQRVVDVLQSAVRELF